MWYMVSCRGESEAQAAWATLVQEAVLASVTQGAVPFGPEFPALVFPEAEKPRALQVLGLHEGPTTATRVPGVRLILTEPVTVLLPHGDAADLVRPVVDLFIQDLPFQAVVVTNPHGSGAPPVEDEPNVLHIRIYSSAALGVRVRPIPAAFGRSLPPGVRDAVVPSGEGARIMAPEGQIAEVVGANLYILLDISHPCDDPEVVIGLLAQVLEAYVELVGPGAVDLEGQFLRAAQRRLAIRRLVAQGRVKLAQTRLHQAEFHHRLCATELEQTLARAGQLEAQHCPDEAQLLGELAALKGLPHVMSTSIRGATLVVETDEILVQSGGLSYSMGPFRIEIPLWAHGLIRVRSEKPVIVAGQVYHTPHVFGEGRPCWGSYGALIDQFLATHDWAMVVQLVLEYVHRVNVGEERALRVLTHGWTPLPEPQVCSCQLPARHPPRRLE